MTGISRGMVGGIARLYVERVWLEYKFFADFRDDIIQKKVHLAYIR